MRCDKVPIAAAAHIGFPGPTSAGADQDGRIRAARGRDGLGGHADIEEQRLMGTSKIVETELSETEHPRAPDEFLGQTASVTRLSEVVVDPGRRREDQRARWELDQR